MRLIDAVLYWWDTRRHGPVRFHSGGVHGRKRVHSDGFERAVTTIPAPKVDPRWKKKQALAAPARYYGDGGTRHASGELDVEVSERGEVVAVWFRCQPLPFRWDVASAARAEAMRCMYRDAGQCRLTGVEILDPEPRT